MLCVWRFKRKDSSTLNCGFPERKKGWFRVPWCPGRCLWFLSLFLLLYTCRFFPLLLASFQLRCQVSSLKFSLTTSGKLIYLTFLEYCMHISVPELVTLYYSCLFACLSSLPARLWTFRDQTLCSCLYCYVINEECPWHVINTELMFMELIRKNSSKFKILFNLQLEYVYK